MDEISENLRNTMLKYNEIELDKDLSVVQSIDGDERKFSNIIISKENFNQMNRECSDFEKMNQIGGLTPIKLNDSKPDIMFNRSDKDYSGTNKEDSSRGQLSFDQKAYKLINGLNDFEMQINKDFDMIENMIEESIDNELKNIKALI